MDRIRVLLEQHKADVAKIDQEIAADARKTANEQGQAWAGAVRQIESAESGLISNILGGRQSLGQSLLQMAGKLVQEELTDDAKYLTQTLLLHQTAEQQKAALEQAGTALHFILNLKDPRV